MDKMTSRIILAVAWMVFRNLLTTFPLGMLALVFVGISKDLHWGPALSIWGILIWFVASEVVGRFMFTFSRSERERFEAFPGGIYAIAMNTLAFRQGIFDDYGLVNATRLAARDRLCFGRSRWRHEVEVVPPSDWRAVTIPLVVAVLVGPLVILSLM